MIKAGDKVKIKNNIEEYIVKEFINNNKSCIITDGIEEIVVFVSSLELVEEKICFTGEKIKLKNNFGCSIEITKNKLGIELDLIHKSGKYNKVNQFIFEDFEELNDFIKVIGFKEVLQEEFNLVKYLGENLSPTKFQNGNTNEYLGYDYNDEEWKIFKVLSKDIITVYFISICDTVLEKLTFEKITPDQLKEAYKKLGWL